MRSDPEPSRESNDRSIADQLRAQAAELESYQRQLRQLANELCLAEERERRTIASDLHDHIGQNLAFLKMRILTLRGNAVFCGFEDDIEEILQLLNRTITATRSLTFQISPPVLYELGLGAALEWLGEQMEARHGLKVRVDTAGIDSELPEALRVTLYKAISELLTNTVKHAGAQSAVVRATHIGDSLRLEVSDDGCGFDPEAAAAAARRSTVYGLFSLRERLRHLGGSLTIDTAPGRGAHIAIEVPAGQEGTAGR